MHKHLWLAACGLALGLTGAASAQMTLPGKFEVTDTGSASYTIPIQVVPGTAGLEPKLSLQYDSRSGNGLLGVGWSLSGLPSITRCGRTIAQDGQVGGVSYDANDRFCLDGQRLIAISGTYGADQTEYRTERESFSKIVSYGTAGSGPAHFKVWTKAGLVMEFGNTADSRIEAQGKASVRVWAINKTLDTKGNYFSVSYIEDNANGEYRPDRIDYTGNTTAGTNPANSVRFVYESRPDVTPLYQAGAIIKTTRRLSRIGIWKADDFVKDYRLSYAASTRGGASQLSSFTMCDASATCLPLFVFHMQAPGELSFSQTGNPILPGAINNGTGINFGDWNGDGLTDLMWFDKSNGNNSWYVAAISENGALNFSSYVNPISPGLLNNSGMLHFGDWNGDGKTDVMRRDVAGTNYWFINNASNGALNFTFIENPISPGGLNNGTGIYLGDWNGDGLTDVMWYDQPSGANYWYMNAGYANGAMSFNAIANPVLPGGINNGTAIIFGDWNGDGLTDLMWYNTGTGANNWYTNNGFANGILNFTQTINPIANGALDASGTTVHAADFNADGITDLYIYHQSTGTNFAAISKGVSDGALAFIRYDYPIISGYINNGTGIYLSDYNGDGRTDILWSDRSNGNNFWYINNGIAGGSLTFSQIVNPIAVGSMNNGTALFVGDWNGDGLTDVMWYDHPSGPNYWQINQKRRPLLLIAQNSAAGSETILNYSALTLSPNVYSKDTGALICTYPCIDVQGPLYVVSEVKSSNGLGGEYRSTYRYVGAKSDQHGRGFLGFRQMIVKDEQTGVEQVTTYRQDYPFTGLVASREKKLGATLLNRSTSSYSATDLGGTRRYPFLTMSLEESWELNGSALPLVTTSYQYDAFGNATEVSVSTGDGHSKVTTNSYQNDSANWLLGRLTRSEVTSTIPSQ